MGNMTRRGPPAAARNAILSGAVELACVYILMGLPGLGLRGYVAGFLVSTALGLLLNWRDVRRCTGLRPRLFQWLTAPGLSALLAGLVTNLLRQVLSGAGMSPLSGAAVCLVFGAVLYLAALQAQGVDLRRIFRLRTA